MTLWCRLQGNPNLQLLLDAWSVSHEEAESRILPQSEQETFDSKGHAWTKLKVAWKTWGSKKPPPVLFTCPRCRTFRKDLWSFGQCQGLDRGVPDSTLQKWKALSSNPSVRTALCSTWGVSVVQASKWFRQASQWKRDLTEEGVEPNPGPFRCRLVSLNCGGMPGVGAAFDEWISTAAADVLCVQELCAKDNGIAALRRRARRAGYFLYTQRGAESVGRWGNSRPNGGVGIFVRQSLPQKPALAACGEVSQLVGVWIGAAIALLGS